MAARKPRSKKAKAPVEVVVDSPAIDEKKMEDEGFKKKRARTSKGHFVKDDPSTPENEAYEWSKPAEVKETPIVDSAPVPTPVPAPEKKVVASVPAPAAKAASNFDETTHSEIPLYGSQRFRAKKAVKRGER